MKNLKFSAQILCFILTFSIEIHVKAAELAHHAATLPLVTEVQEDPADCLKGQDACAIKTFSSERFVLKSAAGDVNLDSASSVIRLSDHQVEYVVGVIWVKSRKEFTVRTEFGDIQLGNDSQAWISRRGDLVTVANVEGQVSMTPRGGHQALAIDVGFENTLGGVGKDGVAESAAPVAMNFQSHVERWARMFDGNKTEFEKQVGEFYKIWTQARDRAADLHQELYSRKVASLKEEHDRQMAKRQAVETKNSELRKEFRRHYYEALGLGSEP